MARDPRPRGVAESECGAVNVYLEPDAWLSQSIHRVAKAMKAHAPKGVTIAASREVADLEVLHVVGWGGVPADLGVRPYAAIQYCLESTENPDVGEWAARVWQAARVVWSYYWLPTENLYRAPLGVDGAAFKLRSGGKRYLIGTSGYVAESECIGEIDVAARSLNRAHFHLGPKINGFATVTRNSITDEQLAEEWGACEYVSGLRRIEGFELPAYEGLACGARPIMFDREHHRRWMGDSAIYVEEQEPAALVLELRDVLSRPAFPVTETERADMLERCSWARIVKGFWERVL